MEANDKNINTGANESALRNIGARVIGVTLNKSRGEPGKSNAVPDNPFRSFEEAGRVLLPPFDMFVLSTLGEYSSTLQPAVDAYAVNIDSFGHRFVSRFKTDAEVDIPANMKKKENKERVKLANFFEYATAESFEDFRMRLRNDLEFTGNGYFEVVRGIKGEIQSLVHIPSYQMRLTAMEENQNLVTRPILELQEDGSVKIVQRKEYKRFRKFVQSRTTTRSARVSSISSNGYATRWFKEFGDARTYHSDTGEMSKKKLAPGKAATEIVHMKLYSPRSPYGLPRFIGNLLSIYGDRAAEEINYVTFKNNNIPSMVILVSNGQMTQGSVDRLNTLVESQIQGNDNRSKFVILEAEGAEEGEDGGQVKLDIKPLVKEQHDDAMFQNYSANNQSKIRQAFRLPPIFTGATDSYNEATAETSRRLADEQIFAPERKRFDSFINRVLFPDMGILYHKYQSNSPNTTDNTELVKILSSAEKTGGINPKIARKILEDVLNMELPGFPEDFDAERPFSLLMAEAVKNQADPTEPGQQVTAIKRLEMIEGIMEISKSLDDEWRTDLLDKEDDE